MDALRMLPYEILGLSVSTEPNREREIQLPKMLSVTLT